jgi:uncharacterized protein
MPVDLIRYDLLAQEALRGVVRRVVADAAKNGLPGEHHFFITFDTAKPGIKMSPRLHAQHPEELTIVLQHQFWDLTATDEAFEVGLSFNGIPERLVVPFDAIKAFFDPSVKFGVQFDSADAGGEEASGKVRGAAGAAMPSGPVNADAAMPGGPVSAAPSIASGDVTSEEPELPPAGGEVVRLDRFRKK